MPTCSANNNFATLLLPFENGTRAHPEPLADLGGYGDLTLCGSGFSVMEAVGRDTLGLDGPLFRSY